MATQFFLDLFNNKNYPAVTRYMRRNGPDPTSSEGQAILAALAPKRRQAALERAIAYRKARKLKKLAQAQHRAARRNKISAKSKRSKSKNK